MKLFLSWSGERSHRVAELIGEWISGVIQKIRPWISSEVDRGTIWFSEIGAALNEVHDGIVCLTRENLNAPWILFEAGALARNFGSNRVCTFLIDVQAKDVSEPLSQFNHTLPTKESMLQLAKTLNERLNEDKLSDAKLKREFDLHWDLFESEFRKILEETKEGEKKPPRKGDHEILNDIVTMLQSVNRKVNLLAELPFMQQGGANFHATMRDDVRNDIRTRVARQQVLEYLRNHSFEEQPRISHRENLGEPNAEEIDTQKEPDDGDEKN